MTPSQKVALEVLDARSRGGVLDHEAHVAKLVANRVGKLPVLGSARLGTGGKDLLRGLVDVIARIADKPGGDAEQADRQLLFRLRQLDAQDRERARDGPALVLVLDHVTDAGNFGAIVRSAEVVGAAGVVIANKRAAEVTVATYKTSAGAVMHLPIAQVPNIARALEDLKEAGFWACGASEHAEQVCWDAPLEGRVALVMGSEGEGISRLVLQTCDFLTKLPQRGETESLNVAQAATALSFEWMRRNRAVLVDGAGE